MHKGLQLKQLKKKADILSSGSRNSERDRIYTLKTDNFSLALLMGLPKGLRSIKADIRGFAVMKSSFCAL